jgi:hypothetical protein
MEVTLPNLMATICFFAALIHSLAAKSIEQLARRFHHRTVFAAFLHFAAEVEVIFGIWAAIYVGFLIVYQGFQPSVEWLDQRNFSEAIFVFVIMAMAATRPVMELAEKGIASIARIVPLSPTLATYAVTLVVGPILGSFITEPAAMTVAALLLKKQILDRSNDEKLIYSTTATLFVNISIGGTLTSFAAPPVLMVARIWNWDSSFMFQHFGWKAVIAVAINAGLALLINRKELKRMSETGAPQAPNTRPSSAWWIKLTHLVFLFLVILTVHHPAFVMGSFLFFLGFTHATEFAQTELKIKESLLVAFFLAGLVVLTAEQGWWLQPLLTSMKDFTLFAGATGLTAITDNAALTSLAAQVHDISDPSKYAIVAGAVAGGGLTLIANAPNPAGYSILRGNFKGGGIQAGKLLSYALIPTLIAGILLWIH